MTHNSTFIDTSAIGLSFLCLIHCLALPLVSVALPLAGTMAEAEWVHQVLVLIALPITAFALLRSSVGSARPDFVFPALLGLGLLLAGAFVEPFHDRERLLTVAGALSLAAAHARRWATRHPPQ
mgnify:FL=1